MESNFCPTFVLHVFCHFIQSQMTNWGHKLDQQDKHLIWWSQRFDFEDKFWSQIGQGHSLVIGWTYYGQSLDMDKVWSNSRGLTLTTSTWKCYSFFIFLLGSSFLLPQEANYQKREFFQLQNWMRQKGFSAWAIQNGPFAALWGHFVLKIFQLFHFHTGRPILITPEG